MEPAPAGGADSPPQPVHLEAEDQVALADRMKAGREAILSEIRKRIIGQEEVVEQVLLSLFWWGCPGSRRRC